MHTRRTLTLALVGSCAVWGSSAFAQSVRYSITDLGALPASNVCPCFFAAALSENGAVAGYYFGPLGERRGFIWQNGVIRDIGGAPDTDHLALGVNNDGVSVGFGDALAFRAQNGVVTDLPTLGGAFGDARAINNHGVIVGSAITSSATGSLQRATRWIGNTVTDLGTFGGEYSNAFGVNDAGQIVGWAWNAARRQIAFKWTPGSGMTPLTIGGTIPTFSAANDINEGGDSVGSASIVVASGIHAGETMFRAILWSGTTAVDLGDLNDPVVNSVGAGSVNDHGQVVGVASRYPDDSDRPFLWENGVITDLNTLVDPNSGWLIFSAAAINNAGQIAASATHTDGRRHAVLLTPIGTPCAADFDGNGVANSQDFFAFLSAFFGGLISADFNQSGGVDSQDFFEFVAAFFAGC